ncbi:MAG: tRNA pseudouridine(13) synthase TruD [Candidatus Burarchaeum sp.]|nr:tRNA pseudouridine(13) synthase TruD [Candidatus Burarchaeum sp.]MDO8339672.1 tRNA pseudouridine(13) synthase TruD [Candidatus Burarchaeum sp.]
MGMLEQLSYLSSISGVGGSLKASPERFVVEEIASDGTVLEVGRKIEKLNGGAGSTEAGNASGRQAAGGEEAGNASGMQAEGRAGAPQDTKFTHFVLQKRSWDTHGALRAIGRQLGCGIKRFSYAGMKDRQALTTQLCGVYGFAPERVMGVRVKDVEILGVWAAADKVRMGELAGNRFTVVVEGMSEGAEQKVKEIFSDLHGRVPNYFGGQRFGMRGNSHKLGECILHGDFEGAVNEYLTGTSETSAEENAEARAARERLSNEKDFAAARQYFPHHLKYELMMLEHLARAPTDFAGAIRRLPRGIMLLFVHALQSHIFNRVLSGKIAAGEVNAETSTSEMGNLIGYETVPTERERKVLEELRIEPENFRLKHMPELGSKGTERQLLVELQGFSFEVLERPTFRFRRKGAPFCEAESGQEGQEAGRFRFALGPGSYATMALREFVDLKNGLKR